MMMMMIPYFANERGVFPTTACSARYHIATLSTSYHNPSDSDDDDDSDDGGEDDDGDDDDDDDGDDSDGD